MLCVVDLTRNVRSATLEQIMWSKQHELANGSDDVLGDSLFEDIEDAHSQKY